VVSVTKQLTTEAQYGTLPLKQYRRTPDLRVCALIELVATHQLHQADHLGVV
jgi:hypothetical protein